MINVAPPPDPNDVALVVEGGMPSADLTSDGQSEAKEVASILGTGRDQPPEVSRELVQRIHRLTENNS